jgi:hypothetical protein
MHHHEGKHRRTTRRASQTNYPEIRAAEDIDALFDGIVSADPGQTGVPCQIRRAVV